MALANIEKVLTLDVYNHDGTKPVVKAIACDKQTRYVDAIIQYDKNAYSVASDADVKLYVVRPDNVGVEITGEVQQITNEEDFTSFMGVRAELTQAALAKHGCLRAQFKITSGDQILRTSQFVINTGEALDESTDDWSGQYQGYNLDELVQNVNEAVAESKKTGEEINVLKNTLNNLGLSVVDGAINITYEEVSA